MQSFQV